MKDNNKNKTKVPNLRFPEFEGEWEVKKLGELGDVKMCRRVFSEETSPMGEVPFYKIGSFGKDADAYISKELYLDYKEKFSFPRKGDILISAAGTIGRTVVYNGEDSYYQDSNIVWIDNDKCTISNEFLYYILQIVKFNTEGGTIQRLYNNILKSTKFRSPKLPEQLKIASFFMLIDNRIQCQSKIIEGLQSFKAALSRKLFSQELRFKDDNGDDFPDWNEKKLGEMCEFFRGSPISKIDLTEDGNYYCIHYGELFTKYSEVIETIVSKTNKENGFLSRIGDILMPSSDVTPNGLAKASAIQLENIILGGDMNVLRPKKDNSVYLSYLLNLNTKKIIEIVSGTTVKHIYNKDLRNLEFVISNSLPEQIKIANFLSAIDEKIETEKKILEQYKIQKAYLLQNMFV